MNNPIPQRPVLLHERIRKAARTLRLNRFLSGMLSGLLGAVVCFLLVVLLDQIHPFSTAGRWAALGVVLACFLGGVVLGVVRAARRISEESMARRIETLAGISGNPLINAVQLDSLLSPESSWRSALFAREGESVFPARFAEVCGWNPVLRKILWLGSLAFLFVTLSLVTDQQRAWNSGLRILQPSANLDPLTSTKIVSVMPGDISLLRGHPLEVTVGLTGQTSVECELQIREVGASWRKIQMLAADSGAFHANIPRILQDSEYRILAGDARSEVFSIKAGAPTHPQELFLDVTPPEYTEIAPFQVPEPTESMMIPAGSEVIVRVAFNRDVLSLELPSSERSTGVALRAIQETPLHWIIPFTPFVSGALELLWKDEFGEEGSKTVRYNVQADASPQIQWTPANAPREVALSPGDFFSMSFEAVDDLGLENVLLWKSRPDGSARELVQNWSNAARSKKFQNSFAVPIPANETAEVLLYSLEALDRNLLSGPGRGQSTPVRVTLRSKEKIEKEQSVRAREERADLARILQMQVENLERTTRCLQSGQRAPLPILLATQEEILTGCQRLYSSTSTSTENFQETLRNLLAGDLPLAVSLLQPVPEEPDPEFADRIGRTIAAQTRILLHLKSAQPGLGAKGETAKIEDVLRRLEFLFRAQKEIRDTTNSEAGLPQLASRQDRLAETVPRIRKSLESSALDAALGSQTARERFASAARILHEDSIYEKMLSTAEFLERKERSSALLVQDQILKSLASILQLLNEWKISKASELAEERKQTAERMHAELEALESIQREVVELSRERSRKIDAGADDIALGEAMEENKQQLVDALEKMLTDMHIFPELKTSNELRSQLLEIYEDVLQADKDAVAAGTLEARETAVQKEEFILSEIEKTKERSADLEMWLPDRNETDKWLMENFDQTELPEIPLVSLPESFDDLVGELLEEQEDLMEQIQDATSNQILAQNPASGWDVRDGPMGSFGAQGKSSNERPNANEQTGRSSGGREGMANGEMVNSAASNLEGRTPEVRRTNDPFQPGQVEDSSGIQQNQATGGGKTGGYSNQAGMDGNAPLRPVRAADRAVTDALAVQQALLAEKTAKTYANASLLFLNSHPLGESARLMDQARLALEDGRVGDFGDLHRRVAVSLASMKNSSFAEPQQTMAGGTTTGGSSGARAVEEEVPDSYRDAVTDYFRLLNSPP